MKHLFILTGIVLMIPITALSQIFTCNDGKVKFDSEAKLEVIKAESNKLSGVIDGSNKNFAFSVSIESFQGFNSDLQREHFNENYMESHKFKTGEFKGKITDAIDLTKPGTYNVKAKGTLNIHGVKKDRTIDARVTVKNKEIKVESDFDVPLSDHKIKVPSVVNQKIASVIKVHIDADMKEKKKESTE
jgi:polyisoprenoid-binding protein YceI